MRSSLRTGKIYAIMSKLVETCRNLLTVTAFLVLFCGLDDSFDLSLLNYFQSENNRPFWWNRP